ncbi:MAG: hypothetical protein ACOX3V_04100 [Bacillota bacterium]
MTRLEDMGVNKYLALTSIVAMYSQRLVRTICPWCKYTETARGKGHPRGRRRLRA